MTIRVLVTGAGGPAAIAFMKALRGQDVEVHAADMSRYAAGLFFVAPEKRVIVPPGDEPELVPELLSYCVRHEIDVLVPLVDQELLAIADARAQFAALGTAVLISNAAAVESALDTWAVVRACFERVDVPLTRLFSRGASFDGWRYPLVVRPRRGRGGMRLVLSSEELAEVERSPDLLVQEYLPGTEHAVDVLSTSRGRVVAAVPRERLAVSHGLSVTARTVRDPELSALARVVVTELGLTGLSTVRFRGGQDGRPKVVRVHPRSSPSVTLTLAAGINLPALALQEALGQDMPERVEDFEEVAMVRTWEERIVPAREVLAAKDGPWEPLGRDGRASRLVH